MLLLFSFNIFAEVVPNPASIGTRATKTASGVDQLDIATPNKNGTSYNSLKELQVSEQGLILNNNKDIVVNTKTAGYVARNRNLDNSAAANLIITEVTGKNRTNINGTVEVAGKRADLVMANRNGIYVNGGNFLNTDRVTLTTGSLQMKNGDLVGIDVSQGQIGIGGKGLDALGLTELELLGKTIDIAGTSKTGSAGIYSIIESGANQKLSTANTGTITIGQKASVGIYAKNESSQANTQSDVTNSGNGKIEVKNEGSAGILSEQSKVTNTATGTNGIIVSAKKSAGIIGKLGSEILMNTGEIYSEGILRQYRLVDSNGAGDSFVSGFLYGFSKQKPITDCLKYATLVSSLTITSPYLYSSKLNSDWLEQEFENNFNIKEKRYDY